MKFLHLLHWLLRDQRNSFVLVLIHQLQQQLYKIVLVLLKYYFYIQVRHRHR